MGNTLYKVTPTLTSECLSCKDKFLQALKYTIPEFAQEYKGEYSFTVQGTEPALQTFIDNYACVDGDQIINDNSECSSDGLQPYIESISKDTIIINKLTEVIITGNNFDNAVKVQIDNVDVQIVSITSTEIKLSLLGNVLSSNILNVTRCGNKSFGTEIVIEVIDKIFGSGPAGDFITSFNKNSGDNLWGSDWELNVYGNINSVNNYFRSSKAGTSSSGTGPSGPMAANDYYGYIETSNPNNGSGQYGTASTKNFRELKSISFDYHMYGAGIGELLVQGRVDDGDWEVIGFMTGQQNSQNDAFLHKEYTCSGYNEIRFCFNMRTPASSYQADIAFDNIKITSV